MGWKLCVLLSTVCFSGNRGDNTSLPHLKGTSPWHYKQTLMHQYEMEWFGLDGCFYGKAGHLKICLKSWCFVSSNEGQSYLTMKDNFTWGLLFHLNDIPMNYFFELTVLKNISLLFSTHSVHSLRFVFSVIKHPLFIRTLSVKYVHPSQRGQQAVEHIKWTLGLGQLPAGIMWPLCKVCSIENTFYVQDNRCRAAQWLAGSGPGSVWWWSHAVWMHQLYFYWFCFFEVKQNAAEKKSSLKLIKRFGQIADFIGDFSRSEVCMLFQKLSPLTVGGDIQLNNLFSSLIHLLPSTWYLQAAAVSIGFVVIWHHEQTEQNRIWFCSLFSPLPRPHLW